MRILAVVMLVFIGFCNTNTPVRAEQSSSCQKQCRDQQRACTANYLAKTCKTEYDICMKVCGRK